MSGNTKQTEKKIEYFLVIRREDLGGSSPIFSEDSFNPELYSQKVKKKYQNYRLEELLSEEQIDKMRQRITEIKNQKVRQYLLDDLENHFVIDLSMPWDE